MPYDQQDLSKRHKIVIFMLEKKSSESDSIWWILLSWIFSEQQLFYVGWHFDI